ncbi:unnamed protein product [Cuscuta campestris]|uniref:Uncharacterized protein n=1 Tax=Cuscuta campestris TaxID=132261 RepID=A0A484LNM4_9ASTE|nr:unnamed protein product [Cuscuta campestris]
MAPANPATWTHEPSIIKEDDLREVAVLLGKGFWVHHPDAVGGLVYPTIQTLRSICLFPHPHAPIFERVEFKHDKWSQQYFVIEFLAHSPLDLPGVVLRSSISRTKFVAAPLAEEVYNALREKGGLIPHHSLQDARLYRKADFYYPLGPDPVPFEGEPSPERSKAPLAVESDPAGSSSPPPETRLKEGVERQKEPETSPETEKEVEVQTEPETPPSKEEEVGEQRDMGAPPEMEREPEKRPEPEGQCSTATPPAFNVPIRRKFTPQTYPAFKEGWTRFSRGLISMQASHWTIQANPEKIKESLKEPTIPQARPDLLALNALYSMEQADGPMELAAERSRVKSLQEQIAAYQRGTQDLETQFDRLRAQISILESKASASEDKVGSLKAELVERESRISELESSLQEAKHEGARLNDLVVKHIEAKGLTLEKLGKERQTASELRSRMGALEKAIATHQEEVATLTDCPC